MKTDKITQKTFEFLESHKVMDKPIGTKLPEDVVLFHKTWALSKGLKLSRHIAQILTETMLVSQDLRGLPSKHRRRTA